MNREQKRKYYKKHRKELNMTWEEFNKPELVESTSTVIEAGHQR